MTRLFRNTLLSFVDFIKKPDEENSFHTPPVSKLKTLFVLYVFELLIFTIFIGLASLLSSLDLMDIGSNKIADLFFEMTPVQLLATVVIAAPVFEELIFRLPLRFKYNYLFRLIVAMIAATRMVPEKRLTEILQRFRPLVFRSFFYVMTITFGLMHITNFENYKELLGWMPFLTIIQLFIGLVLGYLRIKFGLIWSIIYHALNNLIFIGTALLLMNVTSDYHFSGDAYTLSIKTVAKPAYLQNNSFQVVPGKIELKNYKLSEVLKILEATPGKYILIGNYRSMYVDIVFNSTTIKHPVDSARKIVLAHVQKAFSIKISRQFKTKEVLEPYVSDTLKNRIALSRGANTQSKLSLRQISRSLDNTYQDLFIASSDSARLYQIDIDRELPFSKMEEFLFNDYGIKFRRVQKELAFIKVE